MGLDVKLDGPQRFRDILKSTPPPEATAVKPVAPVKESSVTPPVESTDTYVNPATAELLARVTQATQRRQSVKPDPASTVAEDRRVTGETHRAGKARVRGGG